MNEPAQRRSIATLVAIDQPVARRFPLGECATIGRDAECEVQVIDPMVSRRHAEILQRDDGHYELVHVGQSHGTFVGQEAVDRHLLRDGDEIIVGAARFRFEELALNEVGVAALDLEAARKNTAVSFRIDLDPAKAFPPQEDVADERTIRRDYEKLRVAHELSRFLGSAPRLDQLIERTLLTAFELLAAERGVVLLSDPETGRLDPALAYSRTEADAPMVLSATVVQEVLHSGNGIVSADAASDDRFDGSQSIEREGIHSIICVPMRHAQGLVGIIYLDSKTSTYLFDAGDLDLLGAVASQAATTIQNVLLSEQLREESERVEQLVRDLPDAVILLDAEGRIAFLNPQAVHLLACWTGAEVGDPLETIGDLPINEAVNQAAHSPLELAMQAGDNRILRITANNTAESGETVLVIRDVTYERERERVLADHERMRVLGEFAWGIAHDFRNIIQIVDAQADLIQGSANSEDIGRRAESIGRAAGRAMELTRRLVLLGRGGVPEKVTVNLNEVAGRVLEFIESQLPGNIKVKTAFAEDLEPIQADPTQLEQVIVNLSMNAKDAMAGGGVLRVETANEERDGAQRVVIRLADTGTGMPEDVVKRAFEPFFTTKPEGEGSGLGLALVRRMVEEELGGTIELASTLGEGTTFTLSFPPSGATV
ncbi:MAG: ATP-binding protein [Deltaproteobacteria bacterium]|nr:ATP-binding protein [Deltaproteobacteria bacterium]